MYTAERHSSVQQRCDMRLRALGAGAGTSASLVQAGSDLAKLLQKLSGG